MKNLHPERIRADIDAVEAETTARIAVRVLEHETNDAFETARNEFARANLHRHGHRNAVLFLVAPKSRRFAVYGDEAIHERVGDGFWTELVEQMKPYFQRDEATEGILFGINRIGERLLEHFPKPVKSP